MAEGVIIGRKTYPLLHPLTQHPIPVFGVADHGIRFRPGDGYNKPRREDIDLGVFHWTGSENSVERMAETLRKRKLGIEYAISPYGSLYQFCDMMEVNTADAGIANGRSWGVEIVNAGVRRMNTLWREPRYRAVQMGPRTSSIQTIHGKELCVWDFYPAQVMTALALNKLIADAVPTYPETVHRHGGVLDIKALAKPRTEGGHGGVYDIQGAVGHFHVSRKKIDAGRVLMDELDLFMRNGQIAA
jgi:hypothetical protein